MTSYPALSFENWHLLWPLILAARSESIDIFLSHHMDVSLLSCVFIFLSGCSLSSKSSFFLASSRSVDIFFFGILFLFPVSCLPFVLCASQFVALFACLSHAQTD